MIESSRLDISLSAPRFSDSLSKAPRILAVACLFLGAALAASSCSSTEDVDDLDPQQRAKRVTVLQREAKEAMGQFASSTQSPAGADIDKLISVFDKRKEVTRLLPSPAECPTCYSELGETAGILGNYYRNLANQQELRLSDGVSADEAHKLRGLIEKNQALATSYYEEALLNYNAYLQSPPPIDARVYRFAGNASKLLGRYKQALYYHKQWRQAMGRHLSPQQLNSSDDYIAELELQIERQASKRAQDELRRG